MRLTLPLGLVLLAASGAAAAQVDSGEAEASILAACRAESGEDGPERCACYVSEIRSRVPADAYGTMIELAAAVLTGDMAAMQDVIDKSGLDPEATDRMLADMREAVTMAAAICGA